ncbi:response regulator [Allocoleopsis sp.]|uniref:response regulator n=1 Tax=Allocoleopsis sp. TaxID=3088169 RepID=UPI0039C8A2A3
MRMPVMDGYEATRQIREQEASGRGNSTHPLNPVEHQPTVIIALTASAFEEQRSSILAAGCDDFVRKPFREQTIFEKMAEYLGVQYIYEQDTNSRGLQEQTSQGDGKNLTSDDLAVMPADWVTQLNQAAVEVDGDRILQLIEQIPASHLTLAEKLTDLVRRFCFDEILELTEENRHF